MAGFSTSHVPYKGSAPAMIDLLAGNVVLLFDSIPSALPQVRAGKLRCCRNCPHCPGITHAESFFTTDAVDLKNIYSTLTSRFVMEKKQTEITVFFSADATLLALLAAMLSVAWYSRIL